MPQKTQSPIYECRFEDFDSSNHSSKYDLVLFILFSESFQYINISHSLPILDEILKPDGKIVLFDFFSKDGIKGKSPLDGGHPLNGFYKAIESSRFRIIRDEDYTQNLAPNLDLISEILTQRLIPSAHVIDEYLSANYRRIYGFIKFLLRKRLKKVEFKYSAERNAANFAKYKSYRMITLSRR